MIKWLTIAVVIFLLDQISKLAILLYLSFDQTLVIFPGFNLQLAFNKGAAFGFLAQHSGWQRIFFIMMAILVAISIIIWLHKLTKKEFLDSIALSCILGGALGNLLDRIRFGYVVDFIDVYYRDWHWYTFNVADIAICIGATILIYTLVRGNELSKLK